MPRPAQEQTTGQIYYEICAMQETRNVYWPEWRGLTATQHANWEAIAQKLLAMEQARQDRQEDEEDV